MHELSLAENMLDIIQQQAEQDGFTQVTKVTMTIGKLSHVEAEAMAFCFNAVVQNSVAQNASLEIIQVPGRGKCRLCEKVSVVEQLYDPCPHCGEFGMDVVDGDQLAIKSLEVK